MAKKVHLTKHTSDYDENSVEVTDHDTVKVHLTSPLLIVLFILFMSVCLAVSLSIILS